MLLVRSFRGERANLLNHWDNQSGGQLEKKKSLQDKDASLKLHADFSPTTKYLFTTCVKDFMDILHWWVK